MTKTGNNKTNLLPFILVGLGLIVLHRNCHLYSGAKGIDQNIEECIFTPANRSRPARTRTDLIDLEGNEVSLSDFVGQVVLVNNWATWCPPCREEMPEFQSLFRDIQG